MYNPIAVKANGNTITSWNDLVKPDTEVLRDFGIPYWDKESCDGLIGTFIDEKDGESLVKLKGLLLAHCPISNAYFANGVIPITRLKEQGVNDWD